MVETGFNNTEIGKIILAACFINDLGTVLALGLVFANYNLWLALFAGGHRGGPWSWRKFAPWFFEALGERVSEPQTKFVALVLLFARRHGERRGSEAVLPAYLVGMALAPTFLEGPRTAATACASSPSRSSPRSISSRPARSSRHVRVVAAAGLILSVPRDQDGDQVRWHPAADARLSASSRARACIRRS